MSVPPEIALERGDEFIFKRAIQKVMMQHAWSATINICY
ncbi:hypothetical protein JOC74_001249 [Bacillus capparidis]|uniref:Uncharacterized protein n=1 Tax=Bacillus capparidis TaxID=1840411 RepID=A0ABS4CTA8_9BACI|nr:hypothetical protein [Bacillus capparidis]